MTNPSQQVTCPHILGHDDKASNTTARPATTPLFKPLLGLALLVCMASAGCSWTQVSTTGPLPRRGQVMAFDAKTGHIMLFGGLGPPSPNNPTMPTPYPETWEWNGQSWNQLTPATMPTACYASAVACETDKNLVLLFGGVDANTGNEVSQTWVWDGNSWNQPSLSPSPQGRHLHAMAYDSNRKVVVLFGGFTTSVPSGKRADLWDTWEWNGINWTELHPIHSPSAGLGCLRHGMAYDAKQKVVVMFGGCQDTDTSGNPLPKLVPQTHTWEWNGNDWKDDGPNNNPPWRNSGAMAYNGRNVIVFGGYDANNNYLKDTWSWNGTAWTQLNVSQKPAGATLERTEHAMAFDPARNRIVLFGGETGPAHPASILGDTWELQWTPFPWLFQ